MRLRKLLSVFGCPYVVPVRSEEIQIYVHSKEDRMGNLSVCPRYATGCGVNSDLKNYLLCMCACMSVCMSVCVYTHAIALLWNTQDNLEESVLAFHLVESRD